MLTRRLEAITMYSDLDHMSFDLMQDRIGQDELGTNHVGSLEETENSVLVALTRPERQDLPS